MSRWFRLDDDVVNDPKVQCLSGDKFKAWINLLCIASKNGGVLPSIRDIAFNLRMEVRKVSILLDELCALGLIDPVEVSNAPMSYEPHNWSSRQFKSDITDPTTTSRSKRYRDGKRDAKRVADRDDRRDADRDATVTVTLTTTDTESDTEQIQSSEANASGADAPVDHRKRLFNEGLAKLASLTGKGPDACRSFVGKCLKASGDDAITVLGLIEEAERNQVVDPSAWIAVRLKGADNGKPKSAIIQAANDLCERIASFDGPPRSVDELRGGTGKTPPRLLSHG